MDQPRYYEESKPDKGYCVHFANKQGLSIDEIKRIFTEYGEVISVTKAGDDYGFRFVTFRTVEDVEHCIEQLKYHKTIRLLPKRPKNNDQNNGQRKNWNNRQETRTTQSGGHKNYDNSGKRNYNQNNSRYHENNDDAGQTNDNNTRKSWDNDKRNNEFKDNRNNRWDNEETSKSTANQSANDNWDNLANKNTFTAWDNVQKKENTETESWDVEEKKNTNPHSQEAPKKVNVDVETPNLRKKEEIEAKSLENIIEKKENFTESQAKESEEKIVQEVISKKEEIQNDAQIDEIKSQSLQNVAFAPLRSHSEKSSEIIHSSSNNETLLTEAKINDYSVEKTVPVKQEIVLPITSIPQEIIGKDCPKFRENDNKILKSRITRAAEVVVANVEINFGVHYILHLFEKYRPIAVTGIKIVPGAGIRYCIVYFESQDQALAVEQEFDKFKLSGLDLIVLRIQRLVKIAAAS